MNKKNLSFLIFLITLSLLILIIHRIGFSNLYVAIRNANPRYLVLAVMFYISTIFVRTLKWQIFVNGIRKVPFFSLLAISLAGSFIDITAPGPQVAGSPLKAYFLSKKIGVNKTICLSTVIIERITGIFMLSFLGMCSTFFVLIFIHDFPTPLKIIMGFVWLLIICVPVMGYILKKKYKGKSFKGKAIISRIYYFGPFSFLRKKFKTLQIFDDYITLKIGEFAQTSLMLSSDRKKVGLNIILSFIAWTLIFTTTYTLFLSIGYHVSFFAVMIVVSLSTFLSYFFFIPGGAGITELLMISIYISLGIPSAVAASVALLDRFIFYVFSIVVGYISLTYLNIRYANLPDPS